MITLDNLASSAEKQKGASSICAFCFSLVQTFVAYEGSLLVAYKTTDWDTTERPVGDLTIDFGC